METIGNAQLLSFKKIGFLASSHIAVSEVMACYEWASRKMEPETCVVSGFSSRMEHDVLHFLLQAQTPVIWVLARKPYRKLPRELQEALDAGRLLIISISDASRQNKAIAMKRNIYVAEIANQLLLTGVDEASSLYPLRCKYREKLISLST